MKTITEWQNIITTLETRRVNLESHLATIKEQRGKLSLDVALGDEVAAQQAQQLDLEGTQAYLDLQTLTEALSQARMALQAAQQAIRDTQEEDRRVRLGSALGTRKKAAQALDGALATMADRLMDWLATGDEVTRLGGDGHALQLKGQLASAIWHALVSAGLNANSHWQYRIAAANFSGESRPSSSRWKPLADFPD